MWAKTKFRVLWALIIPIFLSDFAFASSRLQDDPDTDGDGLSDFHETHKYLTDPQSADSDGDGIPDSDWNERREFNYSVRTVIHVLPPVTDDVLCDDYQDARILYEGDGWIELEVIHYPFNTVASTIEANPQWRQDTAHMKEWTRPGPSSNWNPSMRAQMIRDLSRDGIDVLALDDKTLVEKASRWLLQHAEYQDGFSSFSCHFPDGAPEIFPGMEKPVASGERESGMTVQEQWEREVLAAGMYKHKMRGSCTSTAIYLNGCLRALDIPTRIVYVTPLVDGSDTREVEMTKTRLTHARVRKTVHRAISQLGNSWASHTFNEVFVGGRWRRLNFDRLGQNIFDPNLFGMVTHIATFHDWADGQMASTWGTRQAHRAHSDDTFQFANGYSTISLSDSIGIHAEMDTEEARNNDGEFRQLTIDRAYWYGDSKLPEVVKMRLDDPDSAGHIIVRVKEGQDEQGPSQYKEFYDRAPKRFRLVGFDGSEIPVHATRGYWARPEEGVQHFYLRIEPDQFRNMPAGVPHRLEADASDSEYRWKVLRNVLIARKGALPNESEGENAQTYGIDEIYWADSPDSPPGAGALMFLSRGQEIGLLARVGTQTEFDDIKEFTRQVDQTFFLKAKGHKPVQMSCGIGGITTRKDSFIVIILDDSSQLKKNVTYTLSARNSNPGFRWEIDQGLKIRRE